MDVIISLIPLLGYLLSILVLYGGHTKMGWEQIVSIILAIIALIGTIISTTKSSNSKIVSMKLDLSKEHSELKGSLLKEHSELLFANQKLDSKIINIDKDTTEVKKVLANIHSSIKEEKYKEDARLLAFSMSEKNISEYTENLTTLIRDWGKSKDVVIDLNSKYLSALSEIEKLKENITILENKNKELQSQVINNKKKTDRSFHFRKERNDVIELNDSATHEDEFEI